MKEKIVIYTFIDAFGYDIFKDYPDFLKDIAVEVKPLKSVLGFTNTCLPSILTGQYSQDHGQASLFLYSKNSPFKWLKPFSILPGIFNRFRVRNILSKVVKKIHGYTGYFQLYSIPFDKLAYFDFTEKKDYFVPHNVEFDTMFNYCVDKKIPYYCSNWRISEEENLKDITNEIEKGEIEFAWLSLQSLDGVMHTHGTKAKQTKEKIKWLDEKLRDIYKKAKNSYEDVTLCIFSDHGMYDVTNGVDLISEINSLGLEYGKDYIAMYDATMARFWFKNDLAKEKITSKLSEIKQGKILDDEELKRLKTYFEDKRFGELFFLVEPKTMINPSFFGNALIKGMHGYHPDVSGSDAMLLSNKPIDKNLNSITDLRANFERELG